MAQRPSAGIGQELLGSGNSIAIGVSGNQKDKSFCCTVKERPLRVNVIPGLVLLTVKW